MPLFGEAQAVVVAAWRMGDGEVLWWAGATPLTNAGIGRADNLALLLNSIRTAGPRASVAIYWDEYFHGQRSSLWAYAQGTPVLWAAWQITLLALAALFTYSRRSGPVVQPAEVSRLTPLEFVETLGGLYRRAGSGPAAVGVALRRLLLALGRRLAVAPGCSEAELARVAEERLGWDGAGFATLLAEAGAAARLGRLPEREALRLVQALQRTTAQLRIQAMGGNKEE